MILDDVRDSIHHYIDHAEDYCGQKLPYFLWGRSAGAYLCLIAAAYGYFETPPAGILSYYGYGFLCDHWFQTPSAYYKTLPPVDASCLSHLPSGYETNGDLNTHYSIYVLRKADRQMVLPSLRRTGKILLSGLHPADLPEPAMSAVRSPRHQRYRRSL